VTCELCRRQTLSDPFLIYDQNCRLTSEVASVLWSELGLRTGAPLDAETWESFMVQFIRRQAERDANMFVVCPSTPAQYFHVLRRQANLPYKRPLVCLVRPC
jgi:hypothetical protein